MRSSITEVQIPGFMLRLATVLHCNIVTWISGDAYLKSCETVPPRPQSKNQKANVLSFPVTLTPPA